MQSSLLQVLFLLLLALRSISGFPARDKNGFDLDQPASLARPTHDIQQSGRQPQFLTDDHAFTEFPADSWKRDDAKGNVIRDEAIGLDMKFISQPEGSNIYSLQDYAYLDYAGAGVTIYVHDSGINLDHVEFQSERPEGVKQPNIQRLIPKKTLDGKEFPQTVKDTDGHGTCIASKIVGKSFGVAKGASLKMVYDGGQEDKEFMLAGMQVIVDDIKRKKKQWSKRNGFFPVINLSYDIPKDFEKTDPSTFSTIRQKYLEMVKNGAFLVAAAGNDGDTPITRYPAKFVEEDEFRSNMVVVGGVDIEGEIWVHSQRDPLVEAWAPAIIYDDSHENRRKDLPCASHESNTEVAYEQGNSFAAPQVAGLAAYYYSSYPELRGKDAAKKIKAKIIESSFPRTEGGKPCIWNLQYGTEICDGE